MDEFCPWGDPLLLLGLRPEVATPESCVQLLLGGREGEREGVWPRLPRFGGRLGIVFS